MRGSDEDASAFQDPPGYPEGGTFAQLLKWHLDWGTTENCSVSKRNPSWIIMDFARFVHKHRKLMDEGKKNIYNWQQGDATPETKEQDRVDRIYLALFGSDPRLQRWKADLENALDRARKEQADARRAKRRASQETTPITSSDSLPLHPAAQVIGHNDVGVSVPTLGVAAAPIALPFKHYQWHKTKAEPANLIELLRTDLRATTLVGRTDELAMLSDWLSSPQSIAIKCIIGGAGAGKTRLAIEACERAEAHGWFATFLPSSELQPTHDLQDLINWVLPQPTLIVVDYAATSALAVKRWLSALVLRSNRSTHNLRILLLERHADREIGWWADLLRPDTIAHASASDLIAAEVPYVLPPLDAARDRRALLSDVMAKAAPLFNPPRAQLELPTPGIDLWFDRRLADNNFGTEPLYLIMAGIRAVERGAPAALAMNRLELARWVAGIEGERLKKFAIARGFTDEGRLLKHVAACVTLQNGCDPSELPSIVKAERHALDMTAPMDDEAVAEILCDFLPMVSKVEPIQPDLIGESFCLPIVKGGPFRKQAVQQEIVMRCWHRDAIGTIETLIRCACDLAQGSSEDSSVRYLRTLVEVSDLDRLVTIAKGLPEQTLALRELATDVQMAIVEQHRLIVQENVSDTSTLDLARSLQNLANRLSDLGRHEEALNAAEAAVALNRELAATRPDVFNRDLAMSLSTLASRLSELGRREDALAKAEEAVDLHRQLSGTRLDDAFTPSRARSLNNLANLLGDLGRRDEAHTVAEEVVALYRRLATADPDVFTHGLARSLNNLANRLSDLGRREEAYATAESAMTLYRQLAVARPDAFTPDLAMSLHNLANRLSDLGQREKARATANEAMTLFRQLATARPDAFTPGLAISLHNLATCLSDLGRREEALTMAEESVALYRQLAATRPDAFTSLLAISLDNLGSCLSELNQHEEAVVVAKEAVALNRKLAVAQPDAFTPELAMSLHTLAVGLGGLGRREEAHLVAEETVALRRQLASAQPDAFDPELARSLSMLGDMLEACGRLSEAIIQSHAAITTLAPYLFAAPQGFSRPMRSYMHDYVRRVEAVGVEPDAVLIEQVSLCLSRSQDKD